MAKASLGGNQRWPMFQANRGAKSMCEVFKGEKLGKRGVDKAS